MSITVTKEFTFDAAHMLVGHEGLCKNLHGHTYKVEVTIRRKSFYLYGKKYEGPLLVGGSSEGMVVDFKYVKQVLDEKLFSLLDHAFICNASKGHEDIETHLAYLLQENGLKVYNMMDRPTAENMCLDFMTKIRDILSALDNGLSLISLRVWETPTSYAEWTRRDD